MKAAPSVTRSRREVRPLHAPLDDRAPLPEPRCKSVCVQLAGRIYVLGGSRDGYDDNRNPITSAFSYDPQTDRWRSESPLPRALSRSNGLIAVAHEGRIVVNGISALHALMCGVWTELPPPPSPHHQLRPCALPVVLEHGLARPRIVPRSKGSI